MHHDYKQIISIHILDKPPSENQGEDSAGASGDSTEPSGGKQEDESKLYQLRF